MTEVKKLVFVSKMYGQQQFVSYSKEKQIAIVGNVQMSKVAPVGTFEKVTLHNLKNSLNFLNKNNYKIYYSSKGFGQPVNSLEELHQAITEMA